MIIFEGNEKFAYRDPTCYFLDGVCHLFFTVSEKDEGYMYNRIAHSKSTNLKSWSDPEFITPKDRSLNYSSPGNIIEHNGKYIMCFCSYPLIKPFAEQYAADENARLFTIETADFKSFSSPKLLNPKGDTPIDRIGRMIDPFVLKKDDEYYLFFKQSGVSLSKSHDLEKWNYIGRTDGGENACVLPHNGEYLLIHSPKNGIAISKSSNLTGWTEHSFTTLNQSDWVWAQDRLTAAFAAELPPEFSYKYIMFFHGSVDVYPETHGNATLAAVFTNDFMNYTDKI